ncbi:MAG: hypothetical protein ACLR2D_07365 [Anaerobutyricum hallii]
MPFKPVHIRQKPLPKLPVMLFADAGIRVTAHIILGLPGETLDMELDTIRYLNTLPVSGIKISMLYVLKNTVLLPEYYEQHPFHILTNGGIYRPSHHLS